MTKTVIQLTPDKHDEALDLLDRCFEASRAWFETHQKADPNWDISQQLVIEDIQRNVYPVIILIILINIVYIN